VVIIAFEGKTDKEFLNSLLDTYELPHNEVTYFNFEGKDNILNVSHSYYDEIEKNYINKIDNMLIVVDADNRADPNPNRGYEASEIALNQLIADLGFDVKIQYHIMCDENREGHLESFLLSVLNEEQKECFKKFKECYTF